MRLHVPHHVTHSLPALSDDSPNAAASHGSNSNPPASLLLDEMQVEPVVSPTESLIEETCVPHSLLPFLPPTAGQDGSLANVFVPLDAIQPSESHADSCAFLNALRPTWVPQCVMRTHSKQHDSHTLVVK